MATWFEDDTVAVGYATARPDVHRLIFERAFARLPADTPCRFAVDIGCGAGGSTRSLTQVAEVAIGVDPSAAMLAAAGSGAVPASFVAGQAERLPVAGAAADLTVAAGSLDFVDLGAALQEVRRVLRPNGWLIVYDFGAASRTRTSDDLSRWYADFLDRYPPAIDDRRPVTRVLLESHTESLCLRSYEPFDIDLVLSPAAYIEYLLAQTNIASAVRYGASCDEIRSWCHETLPGSFLDPQPVVFDGYIALLSRPLAELRRAHM